MSPRGERRSRIAPRVNSGTTNTRGSKPRGPSEGSDKPRKKCAIISVSRNRPGYRAIVAITPDLAQFLRGAGATKHGPPAVAEGATANT